MGFYSRSSKTLPSFWSPNPGHDYAPINKDEGGDDPTAAIEPASRTVSHTLRERRRYNLLRLSSGLGWSILFVSILTNIFTFVGLTRASPEDDPDAIFSNWGKPGTGTEDLAWYPTDFLRDVVPIRCHSHNDYWRKVPLFSALHVGCISVEADVWLFDKKPELFVGHDTASLTPNRTFESLYVNPLVELLNGSNPQTEFYNDTRRGVFDYDPEQTVVLLVDLKTDGAKTWPRVLSQLEPLRSRGWLTYFEDGVVHPGQVTVVGTGNTPFDLVVQNSTYRDAFFDAPLGDMWEDPSSANPPSIRDGPAHDDKNSFYASTSLFEAVGIVWGSFSERQLGIIRGQIKGAHRRGLKARYWDTPSWPISVRNEVWRTLIKEGADILNVDDLKAAAETEW
ncbi:hypothetical protein GGS23DRAFT_167409 [Durotheca rogersii]|uniref:uncharacterized protein n=1 Tax=Durotheca rogersii TaxID=419775 RepID=UPI002220760A|nr:uncharacterized protein GGS23DRAFT_167409 [Durotheca rogersii]KAI5867242.1 hypothetical protein GGS23DRAFT_167409 [Durotheca rogersii]